MAVTTVSQRKIVEVPYQLPDGSIKPHMALSNRGTGTLLYCKDTKNYSIFQIFEQRMQRKIYFLC